MTESDISDFYMWFGLIFTMAYGGIPVSLWGSWYRRENNIKIPHSEGTPPRFPGWITGGMERFVFFLLLAGRVPGGGSAIMTWLGLRQVNVFTNRDATDLEGQAKREWERNAREWHFSAMVLSLINATFAILGGLITIHWWRAERLIPGLEWSRIWIIEQSVVAKLLIIVVAIGIGVGLNKFITSRLKGAVKYWEETSAVAQNAVPQQEEAVPVDAEQDVHHE